MSPAECAYRDQCIARIPAAAAEAKRLRAAYWQSRAHECKARSRVALGLAKGAESVLAELQRQAGKVAP